MTGFPVSQGRQRCSDTEIQTHGERVPGEEGGRNRSGANREIPRVPGNHQKPGERHTTDFYLRSIGGTGLADTLIFQISSLQNGEKIHFCSFKAPSLCSFVTAALGNNIDGKVGKKRKKKYENNVHGLCFLLKMRSSNTL